MCDCTEHTHTSSVSLSSYWPERGHLKRQVRNVPECGPSSCCLSLIARPQIMYSEHQNPRSKKLNLSLLFSYIFLQILNKREEMFSTKEQVTFNSPLLFRSRIEDNVIAFLAFIVAFNRSFLQPDEIAGTGFRHEQVGRSLGNITQFSNSWERECAHFEMFL